MVTITARFDGCCPMCGKTTRKGTVVVRCGSTPSRWAHYKCYKTTEGERKPAPPSLQLKLF